MVDDVIALPEAETDINRAYAWCETQAPGLGDRFLGRFEESLLAFSRTPEGFRAVKGVYRRALVRRFSYSIYYTFDGTTVVVHAVLHSAQEPRGWQTRLSWGDE